MRSALNTVAERSCLPPLPQQRAPGHVTLDPVTREPRGLDGEFPRGPEALVDLMRLAVFDAEGKLVAVLGVASIDPALLRHSHGFTGAVIESTAGVQVDIEAIQARPAAPVYPAHSTPPVAPARGGLPPRALRRVREYVDAHLEESIGLKDLADVAGLSMFHFARAFKQSRGATPNCYLFQRRVERAQQLLADSDLPLSEIAIATGFSDQSHFARRFREHVGTTPAKYRWSKR